MFLGYLNLLSDKPWRPLGQEASWVPSLACCLVLRAWGSRVWVCISLLRCGALLPCEMCHARVVQKFLHLWAMKANGELRGGKNCYCCSAQKLKQFLLNWTCCLAECLCHIISIRQQQLTLQFFLWGDFPIDVCWELGKVRVEALEGKWGWNCRWMEWVSQFRENHSKIDWFPTSAISFICAIA